ncbi:MAG: hypothetical protein K2H82_08735 [Oscillospiraceae bacterium]|nr:hypothetical protein [Oscillospiraceae bacterium]
MKDLTKIFEQAVRRAENCDYNSCYSSLKKQLEEMPCIWRWNDDWSWDMLCGNEHSKSAKAYGYLSRQYPVALLFPECPDMFRTFLQANGILTTDYENICCCDKNILCYYTDKLLIDDRFFGDETLPFSQEDYDKVIEGYSYITPYDFEFDEIKS